MKAAFVAPPVPAVPLSKMQREYYFYLFASRALTVFSHLEVSDFQRFWMLEPVNLGLLQLMAYLEMHGIECSFFGPVCPDGQDIDREAALLSKLKSRAHEFDAIGFTSITASYTTACRMAGEIRREYPGIPLILGGNHAWVRYEEILKDGVFDILVHKEGEETTLDLLRAIEANTPLADIPGLSFIDSGNIVKTKDRGRMDRTVLPMIAYDHLEDNFSTEELGGDTKIRIPVSRVTPVTGCTNNCIWCADYWKPQVTRQDLSIFMREVNYLKKERDSRFFYLGTHDFLHDIPEALRISASMGKTGNIRWEAQTRVNPCVTREQLRELRNNGCCCLHIGVESADQDLIDIMKKNIYIKDVTRMLEMAREEDMFTHTYWLMGSPCETYETARHTMQTMRGWLESDLSSTAEVNMLVAYPGTEYFENGSRYGITWTDPDYSRYDGRNVPTHETSLLTRRDLEYIFHRAMDEYCEGMSRKIGNRDTLIRTLGKKFPNFDPAFMEAAF
jgi:anaerobic magnesium-protoporphyrin IX monomethyl ester cyclase